VGARLQYLPKVLFRLAMVNIERSQETLSLKESEGLGKLPEFRIYL
jgi:hypothetical protein